MFLMSLRYLSAPLSPLMLYWCYRYSSASNKQHVPWELQVVAERFKEELEWAGVENFAFM